MPDMQSSSDQAVNLIKSVPHSVEAEQSVLGGLLQKGQAWDEIADTLIEADFYLPQHQYIFRIIALLIQENKPVDVLTVTEGLSQLHILDQAGGQAYLYQLWNNTPGVANIKAYAEIVAERALLRQMISISGEIADSAFYPEGRSSEVLLDEAEKKMLSIAEARKKTTGPRHIRHYLTGALNTIDTLFRSGAPITGSSTGFDDLDKLCSGLQPGDLIIVAGRPSMGKTAFSMNVAENVGVRTKKPVLVFSMEMPSEQIAFRLISSIGRVEQSRIRSGQLRDEDWPRVNSAITILSETPIFIDDTPALSPFEVRARARRLHREQGEIALILVDYLQLMQIPGSESRVAEISEISRNLKALAKELNVPVIALSQLNRGLEQRPNKRPLMSDLRESGAIEQDADLIMFIYRDEVYHPESPDKGIAEIIVAKHRNGPIGAVRVAFLGKYIRFDNLSTEYRREVQME
jgi:replicative DNA helicase